jgi:NTE family protein
MKIGLALSGGGIRATIFHLGVFRYLAERGFLGQVSQISSVSGASLCVALIFARNGNKWPTDKEFLETELPDIEKTVLVNNIQIGAILKLLTTLWSNKAGLIAQMLRKKWGVVGSLQDLPDSPVWHINSTSFETGKDFRFTKARMGDYLLGSIEYPDFPIAEAAASSAGFPMLIGPLKVDVKKYRFPNYDALRTSGKKPRELKELFLWDGGVYDNLGIEALYANGALKSGTDFLIVSNAGATAGITERKHGVTSVTNIMRLLNITMDQVFSLRSRDVMARVMKQNQGLYVNIGNSAEKITDDAKVDAETKRRLVAECLSPDDAAKVRGYSTTLSSPTKENYELILRHGYENAKCCWECYMGNK